MIWVVAKWFTVEMEIEILTEEGQSYKQLGRLGMILIWTHILMSHSNQIRNNVIYKLYS